MIKQNNKSIDTKNHSKTDNKGLIIGGVLVLLIAITPFLFYSYESFPNSNVWETSFFTLETKFDTWISFAWYFIGKVIPLYLLLIWFFTCKHWWYHVIIVPICMYAFQIYSTINADIEFSDIKELYALAPIIFVMLIFSYTIRTRLFDKIHNIDLSELNRVNWKGELHDTTVSEKTTVETHTNEVDKMAGNTNESAYAAH